VRTTDKKTEIQGVDNYVETVKNLWFCESFKTFHKVINNGDLLIFSVKTGKT